MTDKFIHYEYEGKNLKVPVEQQKEFEKNVPSAKMMLTYNNKNYKVPIGELVTFADKVGADRLTYSAFDDNKEYVPSLSTNKFMYATPSLPKQEEPAGKFEIEDEVAAPAVPDVTPSPSLANAEAVNAASMADVVASEEAADDVTWGQTVSNSVASIGYDYYGKLLNVVTLSKSQQRGSITGLVPAVLTQAWNSRDIDELILDEEDTITKERDRVGELKAEAQKAADPTGGTKGYMDLIREGDFENVAQKGIGDAIQSLPTTLAAKNKYAMLANMALMALDNYVEDTKENPEIAKWKRATHAIATAAFEQIVEKYSDPLFKYFKGGKKMASEVTEEVAKEMFEKGTKKVADRIFDGLEKLGKFTLEVGKSARDEGLEEVVTAFGNDMLGNALDLMSGDEDYGFIAQWKRLKEENPDASLWDFAQAKAKEYIDSFIGGAASGGYMSGSAQTVADAGNYITKKQSESSLKKSYKEGASLGLKNLYDVDALVNDATDAVVSIFTDIDGNSALSKDFVDGMTAEQALTLANSDKVSSYQSDALKALAKRKALKEGLNTGLDNMFANYVSGKKEIANRASENGSLTVGTLNGKAVYVKGGVVSNGAVTLADGSSGPVIVYDITTGEESTANSKDIKNAQSSTTESYLGYMEQRLAENHRKTVEMWQNTMSPFAKKQDIKQYAGKKIVINSGNGLAEVRVESISEDGQVVLKGKKGDLGGQSVLEMDGASFYDAIHRDENGNAVIVENNGQEIEEVEEEAAQPVVPEGPQDYREQAVTILINGVPTDVEVTGQDDTANRITYEYVDANGQRRSGGSTIGAFQSSIQQAAQYQPEVEEAPVEDMPAEAEVAEVAPETPAVEESAEAEVLEPESINWDELFVQDPESYFVELQNQFGEETLDILNEEIEAAQSELESLAKAKTKSQNERLANRKKKGELQKRIDTLNGMVARLAAEPVVEAAPVEETLVEEPVSEEGSLFGQEPVAEVEPAVEVAPEPAVSGIKEPKRTVVKKPRSAEITNGTELAARELGLSNGGIKLLKESFLRHTGYGSSEANKFKGIFRLKENGGLTLEEAGERLMEIDREYDLRLLDQNDPNAGINAILDALAANGSTSELRSYAARNRQAELQREADAIYSYEMEIYEERKKELEDELHRQEVLGAELASGVALTEEGYNELNTIFAEEVYDYEQGNELGEAEGLYDAEDVGDLPAAEGEIYGDSEGGDQVLQEAQPVQTGGEGNLEESGAGNEVSGENAGASVYNGELGASEGESSAEVVEDTFDEDMPDFTSVDEDMPDFTTQTKKAPVAPNPVENPIAEAKRREAQLVSLIERDGVDENLKKDSAKKAGKQVADMFATREAYEAYEAEAADLGEYVDYFDEGVNESFSNRNQYHIGELEQKDSPAWRLATETAINLLNDAGLNVIVLSNEELNNLIAENPKLKSLKTVDGTIYGWTDGKNIYLTEAGLNPNTPIHEYTHLWARAMMKQNPKGWKSIKNLLKNTFAWKEVLNDPNYAGIKNDEDAVASEVLSRFSGSKNAAKLEQMAQQMIDEAKGTMRKAEARGIIQNIKDALNKFWSWVGKKFFEIEKFNSIDEVTDRVLYDLVNQSDLGELSEGQIEASIIPDGDLKAKLQKEIEDGEYITLYRAVRKINGKYYSPKMSKLGGVGQEIVIGQLEQSDERPDLAYPVKMKDGSTKYKVNLDGSDPAGTGLKKRTTAGVDYNPYIHASDSMMNDQFTAAFAMPEMTVIEVRVPKSELTSGYRAQYAADHVGLTPWKSGTVDLKLPKDEQRNVYLSRYDMPVREVPTEEIADHIAAKLLRNNLSMPYNLVTPQVAEALIRRGVDVSEKPSGTVPSGQNEQFKEFKERILTEMKNPQSDPRDKSTSPSPKVESNQTAVLAQTKDAAKIAKSVESLRELAKLSKDVRENNPDRIVNYLADALNIAISKKETSDKSKRNKYVLPNGETLSVRVSKHNASASTYIEFNFNQKYNLAITFKSIHDPNTFKSDENVRLDEYVYFTEKIRKYDGSVLSEVASALADFLETGVYIDTTHLSIINTSPSGIEPRTKDNYTPEILSRKSDAQNAAVDYLVGDSRNEVIENAVNEEAEKLGVKVTYKTREQMEKGHKYDKGYYNTKTGEIVICAENNANIADAIKTILHEAVAHKGLRKLIGDKFNEFINRVYESLDAKTKAEVDKLAAKEYDGDKAVAMEEYMAKIAESTNFSENPVWTKIKSFFNSIINAILGRNDIKFGDNELRYILRASYNNMVNPNGMQTLEGWANDLLMKENYGVNVANTSTPEILSRTGIDEVAFTSARDAYDAVTFNSFTEIWKSFIDAKGFKAKKESAKSGWRKIWNEYQMENQDDQQAVITGIEAIQKETGFMPIEDYENYLIIKNQTSSRSAEEVEVFKNKYFSPIVDELNNAITLVMFARGMNPTDSKRRAEIYAEVVQYLIAKHGLERNEVFQSTRTRKMTEKEQRPLLKQALAEYETAVNMINMNNNLTDAERELQIRDARDAYNAAVADIKSREVADVRDYSGLTGLFGLEAKDFKKAEALAKEFVEKFEGEIGAEGVENLWKRINAATKKTLLHSYESGLIAKAQYEKVRDMFKYYVPLRGFDETTAEDVYEYVHYNGNSFQPTMKDAGGRTSVAFDPISVIMNMAVSEIIQGNNNKAKQALYNYVANRPNSLIEIRDCWYVLDKRTDTMVEAYPDMANGETWEAFENRMKALAENGEAVKRTKNLDLGYRFEKPANKSQHYIHVKINGVERAMFVNGNPRLAEGVNGFSREYRNKFFDAIKTANRMVSSLYTNYNYKFGGSNFIRDFILAQTVMLIKENPIYNLKFVKNWAVCNPVKIGALIRKYNNNTLDMSKKSHRLFSEFVQNGGKTGYVFIDRLEKQKAKIDTAIENISRVGDAKTNAFTKAKVLMDMIQYVNECIELSARFGTYMTSRETKDANGQVRSIMRSVDDAKSVTTNFNRRGAQSGRGIIGGIAQFLGSFGMFYNAGVQGTQMFKSLYDNNPKKFVAVVGGWIGLAFSLPMIISLFGGDDEEEELYYRLPEYQRKNKICIPLGKGKVTLTIPLSAPIRELYAVGVTLNDALFNKTVDKSATAITMECANLLAQAFVPSNPTEGLSVGLTPAESLIMFGTPDFAEPVVEAVINKDYKGMPIEDRSTYKEGAPHYKKVIGKDNWKESVGEALFKLGEDNLDSSLDVPLAAWEHTFSSSIGGVGVLFKDVQNIVESVAKWELPERLDDMPVVRTLFSSNAADDQKFVNNTYWDMVEVYKKKTKVLKTVYGLTEKEAFEEQEGWGENAYFKVYNAKSYPWLQKYYEYDKELKAMQKAIDKMPTDTEVEKEDKVLAEQDLFNRKRDMVYELLEYEID